MEVGASEERAEDAQTTRESCRDGSLILRVRTMTRQGEGRVWAEPGKASQGGPGSLPSIQAAIRASTAQLYSSGSSAQPQLVELQWNQPLKQTQSQLDRALPSEPGLAEPGPAGSYSNMLLLWHLQRLRRQDCEPDPCESIQAGGGGRKGEGGGGETHIFIINTQVSIASSKRLHQMHGGS
ncbi:MAG: hypothetical protein FRX49_02172 [Trebouxia sp. A1-2]|nr:MAG: hypothetical protein FRX49_02172 [Trebouxia sp. A1-2]